MTVLCKVFIMSPERSLTSFGMTIWFWSRRLAVRILPVKFSPLTLYPHKRSVSSRTKWGIPGVQQEIVIWLGVQNC